MKVLSSLVIGSSSIDVTPVSCDVLEALAPGPMVTLGRTVAYATARGPGVRWREVDEAARHEGSAQTHRASAVDNMPVWYEPLPTLTAEAATWTSTI